MPGFAGISGVATIKPKKKKAAKKKYVPVVPSAGRYVKAPAKKKTTLDVVAGKAGVRAQKRTPLAQAQVKQTQKSQKARVTVNPNPDATPRYLRATGKQQVVNPKYKPDHGGLGGEPEKVLIRLKKYERLLPQAQVQVDPITLKDHRSFLKKALGLVESAGTGIHQGLSSGIDYLDQHRVDSDKALRGVGYNRNAGPAFLRPSLAVAQPTDSHAAFNAVRDAQGLGELPFVGGVQLSAAAIEGIKKHPYLLGAGPVGVAAAPFTTKSGQDLAAGTVTGLSQGAVGQAVGAVTPGLPGSFRGAANQAVEHPLFTALDLAGAAGIPGRTAGAFARGLGSTVEAGGVRGALARAGDTVRPSIALGPDGSSQVAHGRYSKDLIRKYLFEKTADRRRAPMLDSTGKPLMDPTRAPGRDVPILKGNDLEVTQYKKRRMDQLASQTNSVERLDRDETQIENTKTHKARESRAGRKLNKRGQAVISAASEGTLRPGKYFAGDVDKRIAVIKRELEAEGKEPGSRYSDTGDVKKAEQELEVLTKLRDNPKAMAQSGRIVEAGKKVGRGRRAQDAEQVRLRTLDPAVAERSPLTTYAMSHIEKNGETARHWTVEEHQQAELKARAVEDRAAAKVKSTEPGTPERAAAVAEHRAARDRRIEVSGKDQAGVRRFEAAQGEAERAKTAHKKAEKEVEKAKSARQRLIGSQQTRRGRRQGADRKATAAEKRKLEAADARVKAAEGKEKAARQARRDAENRIKSGRRRPNTPEGRAHEAADRGVSMPETKAGLRHSDGTYLSNDEIKAHMRAHDVDPNDIGQLAHRDMDGGAFHKRLDLSRPVTGGTTRTGTAFRRGSSGIGKEQVETSAVNAATTIAKAEAQDKILHEVGMRHPAVGKAERGEKLTPDEQKIVDAGGYLNVGEAEKIIKRAKADADVDLEMVRGYNSRLPADDQAAIRDFQRPQPLDELSTKLLNDRIIDPKTAHSKARNIVLVDARDMERLRQHYAPPSEGERLLQMINRPFRFSVLAQPRWLTGNAVEPYLVRLPFSGSGVVNIPGLAMDLRMVRKFVKDLEKKAETDPKVARALREFRAQNQGGLFVGGRGASNHRRAMDSDYAIVRQFGKFRELGGVRQFGDALQWVPEQFFRVNREAIEKWTQDAATAKSLRRDLQEFSNSWFASRKTAGKAWEEAQQGFAGTATQERWMREQHELLGKYEGYSPLARRMIQTITPFAPWSLSAARFVYWTLPVRHSVATALLVRSGQVNEDMYRESHKDLPPGLRNAINRPDGGVVDLQRYTPWGFTGPVAQGDLSGFTEPFLPALSGPKNIIEGKDAFGNELKIQPTADNPTGSVEGKGGKKAAIALYNLFEALGGPIPSQTRRLREKGGTAYADSTFWSPKIKPGSSHGMSALERTEYPFREIYARKGSGSSTSSDPRLKNFGAATTTKKSFSDPRLKNFKP